MTEEEKAIRKRIRDEIRDDFLKGAIGSLIVVVLAVGLYCVLNL